MPDVVVDTKQLKIIVQAVLNDAGFQKVKTSAINLKKGFDINPFNSDSDEYNGLFEENQHNLDLIFDLVTQALMLVRSVVIDGQSLSDPEKHAVAREVLDEVIKLPFYLEWFDGPAIDVVIKFAVKYLNAVNWFSDQTPIIDSPADPA